MAYTSDMQQLIARGTLGAGEMWNNVWTFIKTDPGAAQTDLYADFLDFLAAYAAVTHISNHWAVTGVVSINLGTGDRSEVSGSFPIVGAESSALLPTECAVRLSLSGTGRVRGGPFLCGWAHTATTNDGLLDPTSRNDLDTAVTDFLAALDGHDWALAIDRPTVSNVQLASAVRIGQVFDVIRKRRNDYAEGYLSVVVP